jgi:adenosylcobinamide kinase/adenosylcobinamide-phosphate guanylyltransferase
MSQRLEGRYPVLVLGGVRSGKSRWAETLAAEAGGAVERPVVYLATAEALDEEMATRIAQHRQRRPAHWRTLEEPRAVPERLHALAGTAVVLLECLTLLVNNWIMDGTVTPAQFAQRRDALIAAMRDYPAPLIVVSNEVGLGVMPANPLARRYADWLGLLNQEVARLAARVYLMTAGIPLLVKGDGRP